jgi:hypothetical protein
MEGPVIRSRLGRPVRIEDSSQRGVLGQRNRIRWPGLDPSQPPVGAIDIAAADSHYPTRHSMKPAHHRGGVFFPDRNHVEHNLWRGISKRLGNVANGHRSVGTMYVAHICRELNFVPSAMEHGDLMPLGGEHLDRWWTDEVGPSDHQHSHLRSPA